MVGGHRSDVGEVGGREERCDGRVSLLFCFVFSRCEGLTEQREEWEERNELEEDQDLSEVRLVVIGSRACLIHLSL